MLARGLCFSHVGIPKSLLGLPPSLEAGFKGVFQRDVTLLNSRANTPRGKEQTGKDNGVFKKHKLKKKPSILGTDSMKAKVLEQKG